MIFGVANIHEMLAISLQMAKPLRMVELSFAKSAVDKPNLAIACHPKALERFFV